MAGIEILQIMDFVLLELLLWAGLLFYLWALKDKLGGVESSLELEAQRKDRVAAETNRLVFTQAQRLLEPIGTYQECQIYRFAVVSGKTYEFSYVLPDATTERLGPQHCYLAPGLVYVECALQERAALAH